VEWRKLVLSPDWREFFSPGSKVEPMERKRIELNQILRRVTAEDSMKFQEVIFRARAQLDLLDWLGEQLPKRVSSEGEHEEDGRRVAFPSIRSVP
jgi:hypothetical protein